MPTLTDAQRRIAELTTLNELAQTDKRALAQHASVPLRSDNEVLGILNVATTEFGRFTAPQLQLLSAIGFMLGTAITRARLHEQVKVRRVQEQAALLNLSQELLGAE